MQQRTPGSVVIFAVLSACASDAGLQTGAQELALSRAQVVEHGSLVLGGELFAELTGQSIAHAWELELPLAASVWLETRVAETAAETDTLLELYRQTVRGPRLIVRNDNHAGSSLSALNAELGAGRYRVIVRGGSRSARGPFVLISSCEGNGCLRTAPECLFGEQFSDIRSNPSLQITSETWIRAVSDLGDALEGEQLVVAVQQSSHTDVTTPEEALARVDQQEARRIQLEDLVAGRAFTVFEYGAGDNSYGAFFATGTTSVVASIHDGDLINCNVLGTAL
jgi:hypothetical protein